MLEIAAFLILFIGLTHSFLGERYLLIRLLRRDNLPHLLGSDWFTKQLLRFAWHLTTVAWWGLAAVLWVLSSPAAENNNIIIVVISITFLISGAFAFIFSRGKHLAWVVFFLISAISYYATLG